MILIDDNFCSIVKAVEKGRVIYAGIQKSAAWGGNVAREELRKEALEQLFGKVKLNNENPSFSISMVS